MLNKIMQTYNPPYVEVGSLVSEKVLPQMKGSIELYNYACNKYIDNKFFLLVPNIKYLKKKKKKVLSIILLTIFMATQKK